MNVVRLEAFEIERTSGKILDSLTAKDGVLKVISVERKTVVLGIEDKRSKGTIMANI
jgi:hypothetical protein